jgi:hypothetical protein
MVLGLVDRRGEEMQRDTQLIVFLENRPGTVSETCSVMSEAGVNIKALNLVTINEFGATRMLVDDPVGGVEARRAGQFRFIASEVIVEHAVNQPGAAADLAAKLSRAGVNIECMWGTAGPAGQPSAIILSVDDVDKAAAALE